MSVRYLTDLIVKQRGVINALIAAWPGGKDSVSFAGVARQVFEVMGPQNTDWKEHGGPPPDGRCGYEQFEPDNEHGSITLEQALEGINAIRNSIIGAQTFNWSEHGYPLVSLLDRAGYPGLPYPEAKKNVGTLIERCADLQTAVDDSLAAMISSAYVGSGITEKEAWQTAARLLQGVATENKGANPS